MSYETKTSFTKLLMTDYRPGVCTDLMFRDNTELWPFFEKRKRTGGDKIYRPLILKRASGSTTAHTETGDLATAAQRTKAGAEDTIKFVTTSKRVSQHLLNLVKVNKLRYLAAVDTLVEEAVDEQRDWMEKHFFGEDGYLATCESAADSGGKTTITFPTGTNMDQFEEDMAVAVLLKADHTTDDGHAGTTIYSKDDDARTITLATTVSSAAGIDNTHGVCAVGDCDDSDGILVPNSLNDICSETSTLHGLDVATYANYKSKIYDVSGPAEIEVIQKMIDFGEGRRKARYDRIWGHDSCIRNYQFDLIDPRTIQQPGSGEMGTGAIYFKGRSKRKKKGEVLPIESLVYANPTDRIWAIEDAVIEIFYTAFNEWMSDDTGKILHKVTQKPGYECDFGSEYQMTGFERYKLVAADNIT